MKTFRYMTIAVLSLMTAACSSDIASEQPVAGSQGKGIPFTATISMRESATRSAMTENTSTNTISAAWKTGDELALVYEVSGQKQVTKATMTVRDDKSATITATIAEGVTKGTTVNLLYPYSAVSSDGTLKEDALTGQDGTLETIAEEFDLCQGDGEFTLFSDGSASLKADVTMKSQIAIWKLSLTDGTNALKTEQLLVCKDGNPENMLVNALLPDGAEANSVFYVAVPAISNAKIDIQTTIDANTYYYSKNGVTLEAGKYYQSAVTLADMLHTPLTLEAVEDGDITISIPNSNPDKIYYKINGGAEQELTGDITNVKAGDIVQFFSTNDKIFYGDWDRLIIKPTKKCYVYGNVMSLIDDSGQGFANDKVIGADFALHGLFMGAANLAFHDKKDIVLPATSLNEYCYTFMFSGCSGITRVPDLPATTLSNSCYLQMFSSCTGLTTLPEDLLPAGKDNVGALATSCYGGMFNGCTSLTTAPELPATTLKNSCYSSMFYGCTSLTTAPELPATTVTDGCYDGMFQGCTSLTSAPVLPATTLTNWCYYYMFRGCTNLSSVKCLATNIDATDCLKNWLKDAGTADGCERIVYVDATMTGKDWQLATSGNGNDKIWTIATYTIKEKSQGTLSDYDKKDSQDW